MKINRRARIGWIAKQENRSKTHCDICGEKLWVAPDGKTVYCNTAWDKCRPKLCPRCLQPVIKSENTKYAWQCLKCDEDYYNFEVK